MELFISEIGAHPAQVRLTGMAARYLNLEPAFDEAMGILERREVEIFAAWHGRYVDTGDTMRSLTEPGADGAIREAHHDYAEFGSSIPYVIYLRDQGRSAVMRFDESDAAEVGAAVLAYVMHGIGEFEGDTGGEG